MNYMVRIPPPVKQIMYRLIENGYEAYVVGGCVRDSLLNNEIHDWDICTNAYPDQTKECFPQNKIIDTGIKHGTITIIHDGNSYEVTTYRTEGSYSDHRRPDNVVYVSELYKDMQRRDFTINAMAADIDGNIIDHFGGVEDLEKGIIRCVGNPEERFNEDALRILRALRFAFKYNFQIEEYTNTSLLKKVADLKFVANERIQKEFNQILEYGSFEAMIKYKNILFEIIPELKLQDDYDQKNPYHNLNLLEHTFKTYAQAKKIGLSDIVLILAALLHDIGKPFSQTIDEDNVAHYYEHTKIGEDMSKGVLKKLRYENHIVQDVSSLIKYHDAIILPRKNVVKRWLRKIGDVQFKRLILLKKADISAQDENHISRINQLENVEVILSGVLSEEECFNISHLSINGKDVMDVLHINEGRRVGEVLNLVLEEVISDRLPNNKEDIIRFIFGLQ